ncbi:hypothetical protein [Luteimonas fraxinea]|uniref:Uncharacterized protein n=1 Tax=Luteimonas fraxinea TaxID=2901869 RepID=A0ABS8UBC2_9GAMM|nr:hypothetical protein [Luteimonas fraxinea]MCD9096519.1 hypothetical protein [Luteimonas fraxinea]MCD9127665.1 hypothetical protein [Luteimonas fraxinea]
MMTHHVGRRITGRDNHQSPVVTKITRPSWASVAVLTAWPRLHEVYSQNQASPISAKFMATVQMSTEPRQGCTGNGRQPTNSWSHIVGGLSGSEIYGE